MKNKTQNLRNNPGRMSQDQRQRRTQQVFFVILAAIIILSWVVSLVANI